MKHYQQMLRWTVMLLGTLVVLTGCTYDTTVRQLSPAEQTEFRIYRQIMNAAQTRAYLTRTSAAERTAYLQQIGLAQRFQALEPLDREAILSAFPRAGMSAEALLFVWGEPYYTDGDARRSAHWHYLGSSLGLAERGNQYNNGGNRVDVWLTDGKVVAWIDGPMPDDDKGDSGCGRC